MPVILEPQLEQADMSGTSHTVRAFQHDELSLEIVRAYPRETFTIEPKSTHFRILVFFVPVNASRTISLICACCSSMDRLASITTSPNSLTIFSYSAMMRP